MEIQHSIIGYHQDEQSDWVAELACGHNQHVRHNPPWSNREWVQTHSGRLAKLGFMLPCRKCERNEPADRTA